MPIFKSEKEFEDQFYEELMKRRINPLNGFEVLGVARQVKLGSYGVADLITLELHGIEQVINVIELKNVDYHPGMIFQISRYLQAVRVSADYTKFFSDDYIRLVAFYEGALVSAFAGVKVIGSLVCPSVNLDRFKDGEASAFNALGVNVYDFCFAGLEIAFSSMSDGEPCHDFNFDEMSKIQESLAQISVPLKKSFGSF